jgi:hypothetical protein
MIKYLGIFFGLIISIVFSCTSENSNNRGHLQVMLQALPRLSIQY